MSGSSSEMGFFDQFSGFTSDPTASLLDNFKRLALDQGWKKSKKHKSAYQNQRRTMLAQEVEVYTKAHGFTSSKLEAYQALCEEMGFEDTPNSLKQCRLLLGSVHISIVDLLDARRMSATGQVDRFKYVRDHTFKSASRFRAYMRENDDKVYPKKEAKRKDKEEGALRTLLRKI